MAVTPDDAFTALEVIGTAAFAVAGGAVAVRAGMDWLGVVVLAVVTAVGGGTLRDILLGRFPVWWIQHSWPLAVAGGVAGVVILVGHRIPHVSLDSQRSYLVADAAGLAAFTASGTLVSLDAGVSPWIAVVMGVVTGAGGGVIRDVLARERPLILVGQIYAMAAFAGATAIVVLHELDAPLLATRWAGAVLVFAIRLAAIKWRWQLPRFDPAD
ncbi:MAG: trimeric intracellular cation channel family protein [Ilumatobacteraceae bacterium]